jgi:MoaA/NifB/PqqE/SkfB family radical SAM enzyme
MEFCMSTQKPDNVNEADGSAFLLDYTENEMVFLHDVITAIEQNNMEAALDEIFRLTDGDIPDDCAKNYLLIAQKLCAACEYADGWVMFGRELIRYYIENGLITEAEQRIDELEELLPDDEEVKLLRERIITVARTTVIKTVAVVGITMLSAAIQLKLSYGRNKEEYKLEYFCDISGKKKREVFQGVKTVDIAGLKQLYLSGKIDIIIVETSCDPVRPFKVLKDNGIMDKVYIAAPWFFDGAYDYVPVVSLKYDKDIPLSDALIKADMTKAVLDNIIVMSNWQCNFSCKSCNSASPLVTSEFYSIQSFNEDICKLKQLYWQISRFRISGGEPLLNPDIAEMVKISREAFPGAGLALLSNGILLLDETDRFQKLYQVMRDCKCGFQISTYKPVYEQRDRLDELMKRNGIQMSWGQVSGEPVEYFHTFRMLNPVNDRDEQHRICGGGKNCHTLYEGYVYPCGMAPTAFNIENYFNVEFEGLKSALDEVRIDLHNTKLNGWEINEFLKNPTPMCEYCSIERKRISPWQQCSRRDMKLGDFVLL